MFMRSSQPAIPAATLRHAASPTTGAAVAGAGIANWQSYYGQNLIDQWMIPFFGASVYDDPAVYEKSSPIRFIKSVKTPTLVIVGERDAECPASQSYEFWHALKTLGVPTKLIIYPGEGHLFIEPKEPGRPNGPDSCMVRQIPAVISPLPFLLLLFHFIAVS